jgi:hypothetical protein
VRAVRFAPINRMEVHMRTFALSIASFCALAGATYVPAAQANDLEHPYMHRETSGTWTNAEYDDGTCHYNYSHNAYDGTTNLHKNGDCSHIAIGPDGEATPVYASVPAGVIVAPRARY